MSKQVTPSTDAVALVQNLDPDAISDRIDAIDREREALLVLLRAARRKKPENPGPLPPKVRRTTDSQNTPRKQAAQED